MAIGFEELIRNPPAFYPGQYNKNTGAAFPPGQLTLAH